MAKIKKNIGKGLSSMEKLEEILIDMAKDLQTIKTSINTHRHVIIPGVEASGDVTLVANAEANDTAAVGGKTYKFVAVPAAANDVKIGADLSASALNLQMAINAEEKTDEYGDGTVVNANVIATATAGEVAVVYKTIGVIGNTSPIAVNAGARITASAATLQNGLDDTYVEEIKSNENINILTIE